MIFYAILLFALAVGLGAYMVFMGIRYKRGSKVLGLTHSGFAMVALIMLIVHIFRDATINKLYNSAAILFVMAMAGGLVLLVTRKGSEPPLMVVVFIHAVMALLALTLLVVGYLH